MKHQLLDRRRPVDFSTARAAIPPTRAAWSPWAVAARPFVAVEERQFVRALGDTIGFEPGRDPLGEPFARPDVTLLVNALRCGLSLPRLAAVAPGVQPARMLAAYATLERERSRSAEAWRAIVASPDALAECAQPAARLLPVSVARLTEIASSRPGTLPDAISKLAAAVDAQAAHVRRIEAAIADHSADEAFAAELGALLYDPFGEAVANRPDFLPDRVGLLNPARVAALLGERPVG